MYYSTPVKSWKIFFKRFTILSYFPARIFVAHRILEFRFLRKKKQRIPDKMCCFLTRKERFEFSL